VAEKNKIRAQDHLRLAKERKNAGAVSQADVLRVQVEVANAELSVVKADNWVRISRGNLNTVMGRPIESPVDITLPEETIPDPGSINLTRSLEQAVHNRPELKGALKRVEAQKGGLEVARSAFGPKIRAEGSYGLRDTVILPRDEEWLAGISIEWPIFTGFFRKHRLARTQAEVFKEEAEAKQLLLKVRQEVWTTYSQIVEAYHSVKTSEVLVQDARESLRLARERYEVGAGTVTDLLDAQTALARALATQVEAGWDYHLAKAAFQRAKGALVE
jgi:outer membrane protein TolC